MGEKGFCCKGLWQWRYALCVKCNACKSESCSYVWVHSCHRLPSFILEVFCEYKQKKYEKWHAWKYWACACLLLFMPAVTVLFHFTRLQWQFSGEAHFTLFFSCIFWLIGKARQDAMVLLLWSHLNHKDIRYVKIVKEKEFILDLISSY